MDTGRLLQAFQHLYRDGLSVAAALRLENIAASTYYQWKHDYPGADATLRAEAQISVSSEIEIERTRAARMREVRQLEIEETLLEGVGPVLETLLADAQAAEGLHPRVAALREIRQWLDGKFLHSTVAASAAEPRQIEASRLPDFLSGGEDISEMSVKSASGDEIILKRGD